ncbi:MAG: hypothetical protein ACTTHU_08680 [Treponema sp.]
MEAAIIGERINLIRTKYSGTARLLKDVKEIVLPCRARQRHNIPYGE